MALTEKIEELINLHVKLNMNPYDLDIVGMREAAEAIEIFLRDSGAPESLFNTEYEDEEINF